VATARDHNTTAADPVRRTTPRLSELANGQKAVHVCCEYATGRLAFQMLKDAGWHYSAGCNRVIVAAMLQGDGDHKYGWESGYWISNTQDRADSAAGNSDAQRLAGLVSCVVIFLLFIGVVCALFADFSQARHEMERQRQRKRAIQAETQRLHEKAESRKSEQMERCDYGHEPSEGKGHDAD